MRGQRFRIQPGSFYGVHHGARRDGRAGELVELAAVFFHRKRGVIFTMDHFTGKVQNPVAQTGFNFIAQTRRFMVFRHASTQNSAGEIAADKQLNGAGIAVGRRRFHHRAYRFIPFAGNKEAVRAFPKLRRVYHKAALLQVIIVEI